MSQSAIKQTIGENIRYIRQQRNMSLEDLAEIINVTPGFLGLVERGQRGTDISKLADIAKSFDVTLDYLTTNSNKQNLSLNEKEFDPIESKKSTIYTLIYDMTEKELDFIISTIRSLKHVTRHNDEDEDI